MRVPYSRSSIRFVGGDAWPIAKLANAWIGLKKIRHLLEVDYAEAELMTLVCDNLNTHDIASFFTTCPASDAQRLRLVHRSRDGSWLNMAEMELSILSRQCINRHFKSSDDMTTEIQAWQKRRNDQHLGANWQFTTTDARTKFKAM